MHECTNSDTFADLAFDSNGGLYATGWTEGAVDFDDRKQQGPGFLVHFFKP